MLNNQSSEFRRFAAASALGPEYDNFLYASIAGANEEMPFSVLSALARQNVDPWDEAAELARLPRESAILRLTPVISSLTAGSSARTDPTADAARLVALLPPPAVFTDYRHDKSPGEAPRDYVPLLIYLAVGVLVMASVLVGN
jgi:hypothetical protein